MWNGKIFLGKILGKIKKKRCRKELISKCPNTENEVIADENIHHPCKHHDF